MDFKILLRTVLIVSVLSVIAVLLFRLPAISERFDLSGQTAANIATTLTGLTGPVLSTLTIYFVWITFNAQQKTNAEQRGKNEQDLVLGMIEHLMTDYENFSITNTLKSAKETIVTEKKGSSGMISFVKAFQGVNDPAFAWKNFDNSMSGDHIRFVLASYELIIERIKTSDIELKSRALLEKKMQMFFRLKLDGPIGILAKVFDGLQNEGALEICRFYQRYAAAPRI